jgi:hypothetical protein
MPGMQDEKPEILRRANLCHNILQSDRELQLQIAINCQAKNAISCGKSSGKL